MAILPVPVVKAPAPIAILPGLAVLTSAKSPMAMPAVELETPFPVANPAVPVPQELASKYLFSDIKL